jgi:hypothetical protein
LCHCQGTSGQPNPILPYEDLLSITILLAGRIKARGRRCRMKKGREEKNWGYSVPLSLLSWNLPELRLKEMPI